MSALTITKLVMSHKMQFQSSLASPKNPGHRSNGDDLLPVIYHEFFTPAELRKTSRDEIDQ